MTYVKAKLNWEEVFIQEAIDLEEQMATLDQSALNKSRLRLSFEKDILSWKKYHLWLSAEINCACLSEAIEPEKLNDLVSKAEKTFANFSAHTFWSEDLLPIDMWDNNLIVLGLEKNEKLIEIPNAIFILAPPKILSVFASKLFTNNAFSDDLLLEEPASESSASSNEEDLNTDAAGLLDGIDLNVAAPSLQFNAAALSSSLNGEHPAEQSITIPDEELEKTSPDHEVISLAADSDEGAEKSMMIDLEANASAMSMWDYLSERHEEYCFEARKQFDAYMVLKIVSARTQIFKIDADLQKQNLNAQLFDYSLKDENPFKKVFESGHSESFNINQLGFTISDFKYACITPLKRGHETVGFLVGLKTKNLAEKDQTLLEDLAKESA